MFRCKRKEWERREYAVGYNVVKNEGEMYGGKEI